jgi:hypothetical protein
VRVARRRRRKKNLNNKSRWHTSTCLETSSEAPAARKVAKCPKGIAFIYSGPNEAAVVRLCTYFPSDCQTDFGLSWRHGVVVIGSASGTEDRGSESPQGYVYVVKKLPIAILLFCLLTRRNLHRHCFSYLHSVICIVIVLIAHPKKSGNRLWLERERLEDTSPASAQRMEADQGPIL